MFADGDIVSLVENTSRLNTEAHLELGHASPSYYRDFMRVLTVYAHCVWLDMIPSGGCRGIVHIHFALPLPAPFPLLSTKYTVSLSLDI